MRDCPFCFTPIGDEATQCPGCGRRIDVFRTGYYSRPTLPPVRRAAVLLAVTGLLAILATGIVWSCRTRSRRSGSAAQNLELSKQPEPVA